MIFSLENKNPDKTALLSDTGLAVTYGELCRFPEEMKCHVKERKLAFCMCENSPGAVAGYIGFIENKTVPLMLDAGTGEIQIKNFLNTYRPDYIWAPLSKEQEFTALLMSAPVFNACEYSLWDLNKSGNNAKENEEDKSCELHPDLALLLATSGSTGSPKLVKLTMKNVESNAQAILEYLHIDENERPITSLPLQYTYGLSIVNSHLLAGATVLMTKSSYVQSGFWEFLEKEKATSFGGVPYTYQILKKMRVFRKDIPSIRYLTQAGGKLPKELQEEIGLWAEKFKKKFYVMYGQTEATARMAYLPAEKCLEKLGSMGIAIPGGRFYLIDEKGSETDGIGVTGELIYEGPNVFMGYANTKADLLTGDENHGRLETGDLAKRDEDGFYYIVGRKKRFIKMYGIRVSLDQCENILKEIYPEAEIICGGSDDNIKIYTTDENVSRSAPEKLADILKMSPKGFSGVYVEKIPRNSAGKIMYKELMKEEK
jgi:long-chain acyl-CoA synthetase